MLVQIIKESLSLSCEMTNYAKAAANPSEMVELSLQDIQGYCGLLKKDIGNVHIKMPVKVKTVVTNTTIIYKDFCPVFKKVMFLDSDRIEEWMALVFG